MIKIQDDTLKDGEENLPFVSYELTEYLGKVFDISTLLRVRSECSESMRLGYIKGVQDVLDTLHGLQRQRAGDG